MYLCVCVYVVCALEPNMKRQCLPEFYIFNGFSEFSNFTSVMLSNSLNVLPYHWIHCRKQCDRLKRKCKGVATKRFHCIVYGMKGRRICTKFHFDRDIYEINLVIFYTTYIIMPDLLLWDIIRMAWVLIIFCSRNVILAMWTVALFVQCTTIVKPDYEP